MLDHIITGGLLILVIVYTGVESGRKQKADQDQKAEEMERYNPNKGKRVLVSAYYRSV